VWDRSWLLLSTPGEPALTTPRRQARSPSPNAEPEGRDTLRRVLIRDQADATRSLHAGSAYRDEPGDDWADIIDMLTMYPMLRRRIVRLLGEIEAVERR